MAHSQEKEVPEEAQTLDLRDEDFILNMLRTLKENIDKELKKIRGTVYKHMGNINWEIEIRKIK